MQYATLLFDVRDNVAHITLNRPEAANCLNKEMAVDLMHAVIRCSEDPEIRAVVMTGAGSTFSGGGDLKSFAAQGEQLPYHLKEVTTYLHAAISRLVRMDAPVVAAVQGSAAGAGMSLACACDMVVAAESARFVAVRSRGRYRKLRPQRSLRLRGEKSGTVDRAMPPVWRLPPTRGFQPFRRVGWPPEPRRKADPTGGSDIAAWQAAVSPCWTARPACARRAATCTPMPTAARACLPLFSP